MYIQPWGSCS